MIFEVCAIVAVIIFGILAIYSIRTLLALRRTLNYHTALIVHLNEKILKMDSFFQSISNLGDISEVKTLQLRERLLHPKPIESEDPDDCSEDLVTLLMAALRLVSKYLRRK